MIKRIEGESKNLVLPPEERQRHPDTALAARGPGVGNWRMTDSLRMHAILCLVLFLSGPLALGAATNAVPAAAKGPKFQKVLPQTPPGFQVVTETLGTYGTNKVVLTVYVPPGGGAHPAILDIHGGGWQARQVENDKPMMERLARRGYVTALVAYRLSGQAPFPAALHDCKAAVRHLRSNALKYKIDPKRIGVMGGSAGGHLSGLLAMTSGKPEFEGSGRNPGVSSAVQACIVMAATQDLVAANKDKASPNAVAFFGGTCAEKPDVYRDASPISHVRPGVPPTLFIEGEKDSLKIGRAEMQEKLRSLHIDTDVHTLKDAPHPFWMSQPWLDQTVDIADAFFRKHLGAPPAPRR